MNNKLAKMGGKQLEILRTLFWFDIFMIIKIYVVEKTKRCDICVPCVWWKLLHRGVYAMEFANYLTSNQLFGYYSMSFVMTMKTCGLQKFFFKKTRLIMLHIM